ncbi:MAG: aminotransferase class IV [Omnitrophica bacterium]|nr:aminotransferase class IV [Candidatus Omnitrophota bacterium]
MKVAYLNGKFIPLDKARVSILDRGFLYGDGVFETMRSRGGVVLHIDKHLERLFKSLGVFRIRFTSGKAKIRKIIYKLLGKNKLKDAYIKIIVTRGETNGLLIPRGRGLSTLAIYALPYKALRKNVYEKGISVLISETRYDGKSRVAGNKTLNYMNNFLCRDAAGRKGFDDVVFINTDGFIAEASSSNIFLISGKKIYTPSLKSGILPGITREEVIRLARRCLRHNVVESFLRPGALRRAREIFLTNSLAGIVPVVKVGESVVGCGRPGGLTKKLMELLK